MFKDINIIDKEFKFEYGIDANGNVINYETFKTLSWRKENKGKKISPEVRLKDKSGKNIYLKVALLVYSTYNNIPYEKCKKNIKYKDGDVYNVKLDNLYI